MVLFNQIWAVLIFSVVLQSVQGKNTKNDAGNDEGQDSEFTTMFLFKHKLT